MTIDENVVFNKSNCNYVIINGPVMPKRAVDLDGESVRLAEYCLKVLRITDSLG